MAGLDTESKRRSSVALLSPWMKAPPRPDGVIDAGDRAHLAMTYSGIAVESPVAPPVQTGGSPRPVEHRPRRRPQLVAIVPERAIGYGVASCELDVIVNVSVEATGQGTAAAFALAVRSSPEVVASARLLPVAEVGATETRNLGEMDAAIKRLRFEIQDREELELLGVRVGKPTTFADFRCPGCRHYVATLPVGTRIPRGYCKSCGSKYRNQVVR